MERLRTLLVQPARMIRSSFTCAGAPLKRVRPFRVSPFVFVLVCLLLAGAAPSERWGFWGHRRINRLAVFTLPPEMIPFFKQNIEYLTEHAVDPDKRRYATRHEAVRHYIDIDHWGKAPFPEVPRNWTDALMKFTEVGLLQPSGDTLLLSRDTVDGRVLISLDLGAGKVQAPYASAYRSFFQENLMPQYYEDEWRVDCDTLRELFGLSAEALPCASAYAVDHFSEYGILPYHLPVMQRRLTEAFRRKDVPAILRTAAEFGHYIGDGHVPLHTTENYNGQLTNQVGIHAFWESRIPELFADREYDYFVGKADYIADPNAYYWEVVLASHALVDSVLHIERELSETFPEDKQYCYEERLGRTIRTQCKEYAAAYHRRLSGMVEQRLRDAVHAIGSAWYTAWVDAGQPDLNIDRYELSPGEAEELRALEERVQSGKQQGRAHE
ncbi:zinc dependent phospholipase C family protein [Phaeodactylibacter luteus]|uniref:zinc dependent phospholipase C family protein n=1 Tax=Phaeodactylibacter luteus TaxID=1564516 RepID=UPI001FE9736E|nr:zinc dependent phospholipase C family protein [Phaeodactylibacter luteus]